MISLISKTGFNVIDRNLTASLTPQEPMQSLDLVDVTLQIAATGVIPTLSYNIDTTKTTNILISKPSLDISIQDTTLGKDISTKVTFTFDRVVTGFDESDILLSAGLKLKSGSLLPNGTDLKSYTAEVVGSPVARETKATVSVKDGAYSDLGNNLGQGDSAAVTVKPNAIEVKNGDNLQEAINNAKAGDTLIVRSGEYTGNLTINKALFILGANDGAASTAANRLAESVIKGKVTVTADDVTISGFTLTKPDSATMIDGNRFMGWSGTSLNVDSASDNTMIENNVIEVFGAQGGFSGLGFVQLYGANAAFTGNTVRAGEGYDSGNDMRGFAALDVRETGLVTISNNKIDVSAKGSGVFMQAGAAVIENNEFGGTVKSGIGVFGKYGDLTVRGNTITGRESGSITIVDPDTAGIRTVRIESNKIAGSNPISVSPSELLNYKTSEDDSASTLSAQKLEALLNANPGSDKIVAKSKTPFMFDGVSTKTVIYGNNSNNVLSGSSDVDYLLGNGGKDSLTGGAGNDFFVFKATDADTAVTGPAAVTDVINDFQTGADKIKGSWGQASSNNFKVDTGTYANLDDLLAQADKTLDGTAKYFVAQQGSDSYLVTDQDGIGYTEVIQLVGVTASSLTSTDLI